MQPLLELLKEMNLFVEEQDDFASENLRTTPAGSTIHGSHHGDKEHADKIWHHIKQSMDDAHADGKPVSYRHEGKTPGGAKGSVEKTLHDRAKAHAKKHKMKWKSSSAEHDDADFDTEGTKVRKAMHKAAGGNKHHVNASRYAYEMASGKHGRGHENLKHLVEHPEARKHLEDHGYKPKNFDKPSPKDHKHLDKIAFPEYHKEGKKGTAIHKQQQIINKHRVDGFHRNIKEDEKQGHHSVTVIGHGHLRNIKEEHPAETGIKLDIAMDKGKAPVHDIKRNKPSGGSYEKT